MEAPKKGRFQAFKDKTTKIWRKRRHPAIDKKSTVKETQNSQKPPLSTSEDSEMSNSETTVDLPKPQDDQTTGTSMKEQSTSDKTCVDITPVNMTSADSEKRLKDMPSDGQQRLIICLQPIDVLGNDYRRLADKLGYTNERIKYLGSTNEPVKTLINEKREMKIVEWIALLEDMERLDVVKELQDILEETPTPKEKEEQRNTREKNTKLMTTCEDYDAFICFAENDREFVDLLTKRMEGQPYDLHLCLSERDFLPGGSIYDITAEAIERCLKFVVILSKHFDDSDGAHFESQIAMSLSPGAKEKRFIPVLIDEDYRGKIPRSFSHITYLDRLRQEENDFWKKLAISLGWKEPKAGCKKKHGR